MVEFHDLRSSYGDTLGLTSEASVSGGISACSEEELVFISDSLHDRIIITNGSGRVLDYVGHAPLLCACLFSFLWLHSSWCISIINSISFSPRCCFKSINYVARFPGSYFLFFLCIFNTKDSTNIDLCADWVGCRL